MKLHNACQKNHWDGKEQKQNDYVGDKPENLAAEWHQPNTSAINDHSADTARKSIERWPTKFSST
jgi:hypothetical protein